MTGTAAASLRLAWSTRAAVPFLLARVLGTRARSARTAYAASWKTCAAGPGMRLDPSRTLSWPLCRGQPRPTATRAGVRGAILRAKYERRALDGRRAWSWSCPACCLSRVRNTLCRHGAPPHPGERRRAGLRLHRAGACLRPSASGYNVPERLARPLAEALGVPAAAPGAPPRPGTRSGQAGLSLDERMANVAGAFRAPDPAQVEGQAGAAGGRRHHHRGHCRRLHPGAAGRRSRQRLCSGPAPRWNLTHHRSAKCPSTRPPKNRRRRT